MEIAGYIASLVIGISLGLIGGGGSILTVPVLVYLFSLQPMLATSYSLFIVGSTSFVGAVSNLKKGLVNVKTALLFGSSSIITVFLTRKILISNIPANIANIGGFTVTLSILTMVLFAILMLIASFVMIRNNRKGIELQRNEPLKPKLFRLIIYGISIGLVTGFLGAGGGFLLIPTLVLLLGLPMKEAIGTSLFIIALNSLFGFMGDIGQYTFDWFFLLKITTVAIIGIFIGEVIGKKIKGDELKKGFGWFILVIGIYIIVKELVFPASGGH